jgi:hypothetical protein
VSDPVYLSIIIADKIRFIYYFRGGIGVLYFMLEVKLPEKDKGF